MVPLYNFSISVILSRCTCAAAPRPADDGATRPRRRRRVRPTVESPPGAGAQRGPARAALARLRAHRRARRAAPPRPRTPAGAPRRPVLKPRTGRVVAATTIRGLRRLLSAPRTIRVAAAASTRPGPQRDPGHAAVDSDAGGDGLGAVRALPGLLEVREQLRDSRVRLSRRAPPVLARLAEVLHGGEVLLPLRRQLGRRGLLVRRGRVRRGPVPARLACYSVGVYSGGGSRRRRGHDVDIPWRWR